MDKERLKETEKIFQEINLKIEKIMRYKTKIKYDIVEEIKPSPTGKYMYAFSKIAQV